MAESYAHDPVMKKPVERKKSPKVIDHLHIRPTMDGGHVVEQHFTNYEHGPESKEFSGPHAAVSLPAGHVLHHIAGHMGIPITKAADSNEDGTE